MELPKISDTQKKILKSSLISLVIILILIALGLIFSKQKNAILKNVLDSQNKTSSSALVATGTEKGDTGTTTTVTGPDGKPVTTTTTIGPDGKTVITTTTIGPDGKPVTITKSTTTKPVQSKGVVSFLRDFFSGKTSEDLSTKVNSSAPILDSIEKELETIAPTTNGGVNKYGLASNDPRVLKQLQEAHDNYVKLQEQLQTASHQLQQSQQQLSSYQTSAAGGSQSSLLFQSTTNSIGGQLSQYQGQVIDMQAQMTFAAVEMAYYFCQGITPGANAGTMQLVTLDQIADGSIQLFSDDGSFNYQVCGSLLNWMHSLPTWLQAQGSSLQIADYLPYLQQIILSASFYYCPTLPPGQVPPPGQVTLGSVLNQMTTFTPPNCPPVAQNVAGQYTSTGIPTTPGSQYNQTGTPSTSIPEYQGVTLAITSISPNPVLSAVPVTISWYSTGIDQNTCTIIDITNDPTNFGAGTVIATQQPNIGSFQFMPIQSIGVHTIGMSCNSTQNGVVQTIKDKKDFTLVQSTTAPFVALSISDTNIVVGEPSPKLTWTSQAILDNKCTLYKNGAKVTENLSKTGTSYQLPIETTIGTAFHQFVCLSEQNVLVPSNAVMHTITQPGAITVDLKANGQDTLNFSGNSQQVNFTWTGTGTINSCVGNIVPGVTLPATYSGTNYSKDVKSSQYFTISCSGPGNQKATDLVLIQKLPATPPLPITVNLKVNNQDSLTQTATTPINGVFTWNSTGPVSSCISNFATPVTSILPAQYSGTNYSKTIKKASYFTISCTGVSGQQATDTVLISMGQDYPSQVMYTESTLEYTKQPDYTKTNPGYQKAPGYNFIHYWGGIPPWITLLDLVNGDLKKVVVGMLVYTQLYVNPIIKNLTPAVWQSRVDLNVTVDPQKSHIEENEMYVAGRIGTQALGVDNLRMVVRYGTLPGVTTKQQAQNLAGALSAKLFKTASLQTQGVEFYKTDSAGNITTSSSISIPPFSSVLFGARITNLDKDKPYFFDVVDASVLAPVLKNLN